MKNWIRDTNPFGLAVPPEWWLRKLHDFDATLVLLPSRQQMVYRLAQRHNGMDHSVRIAYGSLWNESDTRMMYGHGLIPICPLFLPVYWDDPGMWHELAMKAPWRQGGGEAVADRLDRADRLRVKERRQQVADRLNDAGDYAWKLLMRAAGRGRTYHSRGLSPWTA